MTLKVKDTATYLHVFHDTFDDLRISVWSQVQFLHFDSKKKKSLVQYTLFIT